MLGSSTPVLDREGIERIALVPGARAPQPVEAKPIVPAAPPTPPVAAAKAAPAPAIAFTPGREVVLTEKPVAAPVVVHSPTALALPPKSSVSTPFVAPSARETAKAPPQPIVSQNKRPITTMNELIIDCIRTIPAGGKYQADAAAIELLKTAVTVSEKRLAVMPDLARPSFCSSATYLVFLTAMDRLHRGNRIRLPDDAMNSLLITGQPDGEGVWGRWNANGPGTARLFHELGLGHSFSNPVAAKPGDFLKIWWNDEIGASERGHSVIFLGIGKTEKGEMGVRYWSSNKPGGFGEAVAPMSTVKRMLFSRLDNPRALANAALIPASDQYLADMLKRASTEEEMFRMCGVQ